MAEKIYTPIEWHDDGPPDLNAENLNHIEKGIDDLDRSLADRRKEIELLQTAIEELKTTLNDTITEKLESKIDVSRITNDLLATEPGFVLDARQGKALKDLVNQQNSDYIKITNVSATFTVGAGATAPAKVNHTTPTGYSIGAITFKMGSADVMSGCIGHYDDKSVTIWISSRHAAELTRPIDVLILYYRSE